MIWPFIILTKFQNKIAMVNKFQDRVRFPWRMIKIVVYFEHNTEQNLYINDCIITIVAQRF